MAKSIMTLKSINKETRNAVIAYLKKELLSMAENGTIKFGSENEKNAYPHWVEGQRRGLDRFFKHNETTGKFIPNDNRMPQIIDTKDIVSFFLAYMEKCQKNGIDPTNTPKAGRRKVKVTIETPSLELCMETETDASIEEVIEVVAEEVEEEELIPSF